MTTLGIDRSHFNAEPDFARFKAAGGGFVFCKATEGVGWADPTFAACRAGTEAAGLVFGSYHFARWGDPLAEARYYLSVATPRPGELVALDDESTVPAGVDVVGWSLAFCSAVHAVTGAWPFVYMNQAWLTLHNWASVAANDGLWLAKYDGQPTGGPIGQFPVLALKQYTDRGSVPGEPGTVDVDAFQGDLAALLRYAVPGGAPAPTPGGNVATLDAEDLANINGAVWGGPGVPLWTVEGVTPAGSPGEWPKTTLTSLWARIQRDALTPALAPLNAALQSMAGLLAQGHADLTKDEILATVDAAIRDATVNVDVNVNHPAAPTT